MGYTDSHGEKLRAPINGLDQLVQAHGGRVGTPHNVHARTLVTWLPHVAAVCLISENLIPG